MGGRAAPSSRCGSEYVKTRLAVLHIVAAGLLVAAWLSGALGIVTGADRIHAAPVVLVVLAYGLWLGWRDDWDGAAWVGDKLPVIGLLGTVLGILLAIRDAQGMDLDTGRLQLFSEIGNSLVANLVGMAGYAWLALVRRVCAP